MTTRWRLLVWGRGCSQRHVRWSFRSNAFLIERSSVLSSSHAVDLSPEVEEGGFRQELYHGAAVGLLWPSAAVGRPGPVSCGVTNVGRQRQGGGRLPGSLTPLGSAPGRLCTPSPPAIFPQHVLLSGARAGQICFFGEKAPPKSSWCAAALPFNVFIYHSQWPCSVLKWEGGGNGWLIHTSIVWELQMHGWEIHGLHVLWFCSGQYEACQVLIGDIYNTVSWNYKQLALSVLQRSETYIPANQHG